ncbi:MAG: DUF4271 domain-containing protein [Muribaculaceae bacterium]|nr:DUF4271 domain-containing protein [Muribaculaceae bacterium]
MPQTLAHNTPLDSLHAADSAATYYAPQYTDAFPTAQDSDTLLMAESVQSLPLMEKHPLQPAVPRKSLLIEDTGAMLLLLATVLFLTVSYRTGYKYIENFFHNMFSVRRRDNLFEDHTVKETQILSALVAVACVAEGLLGYFALSLHVPDLRLALAGQPTLAIGLLSAIALAFYLAQLVCFHLLGYVFADKVSTKLWLDGFKASQSILGIALLPVAGIALAVPSLVKAMLIVGIILYFCVRILFICKGLRIFYSNLLSLVYFILYLCTVEIVPLALMTVLTVSLCRLMLL